MTDQLELTRLTSSMGIGFLADRGLMALASHHPKDLPTQDREVLRRNRLVIHSLFLAEPDDLVSVERMAFLEAAQSDWYQRVLDEAQAKSRGRTAANRLKSWAECAVKAAEQLADGVKPEKDHYECLETLLEALSKTTLQYVGDIQERSVAERRRWAF